MAKIPGTYITEQKFIAHDYFDIGIVGIGENQTDVKLVFCAYVIDNGEIFYLDGGEGLAMDYNVTKEFATAVRDEIQGTYVTGLSIELTAGEHTLVVKYNPLCSKTMHFRNFYFIKMAEETPAA